MTYRVKITQPDGSIVKVLAGASTEDAAIAIAKATWFLTDEEAEDAVIEIEKGFVQ
jgi:hypothetical protein